MKKFISFQINPLMIRRTLMTVLGIFLVGLAVGMFKVSNFGVDPFQVLCAGINHVIPIPFGTLYVCINLVLLIAMFIVDKHYIGLSTLLNLLLLGYIIQYSQALLMYLFPDPGLGVRIALLIVGIPLLCLSASLYFVADLGVSTYDIWALELEKKTPAPFRLLRVGTDLFCVITGFILMGFHAANTIGIGTIITAFFMGPLIDFFRRKVAMPMLYHKNA